MSALEVKIGRWLGDSYVARKGSELEVRHRERGGMPLEKPGPARGGGAASRHALASRSVGKRLTPSHKPHITAARVCGRR